MSHINNPDREVHASMRDSVSSRIELVRYDKQGRWYVERIDDETELLTSRTRVSTVREAVTYAVMLEQDGGTIFEKRPGGKHFDYIVQSIRAKAGA